MWAASHPSVVADPPDGSTASSPTCAFEERTRSTLLLLFSHAASCELAHLISFIGPNGMRTRRLEGVELILPRHLATENSHTAGLCKSAALHCLRVNKRVRERRIEPKNVHVAPLERRTHKECGGMLRHCQIAESTPAEKTTVISASSHLTKSI